MAFGQFFAEIIGIKALFKKNISIKINFFKIGGVILALLVSFKERHFLTKVLSFSWQNLQLLRDQDEKL